jgi:hypothetical protein
LKDVSLGGGEMNVLFRCFLSLGAVGLIHLWLGGETAAQSSPTKVYVVDFSGVLTKGMGEVLASKVSVALVEAGIEAYTYKNLADQLKQEEMKEILRCERDSKCVAELVSSFGLATRLFGDVKKVGNRYYIELTLVKKDKVERKIEDELECHEEDLTAVVKRMGLEILGRAVAPGATEATPAGGEGVPRPKGMVAPVREFPVEFESNPPSALVEIDGVARRATKCSLFLTEGVHTVRMSLAEYEAKEGTLIVKGEEKVRWSLAPAVAWLDVSSEPPGVLTEIRHEARGTMQRVTTPVSSRKLDPGAYVIETVAPDFVPDRKRVTLAKGQRLQVKLAPIPREGWLKLKAFDERGDAVKGEVRAGGVLLGGMPGPWKLRIGKHSLEISAVGYPTLKTEALIEEGGTTEASVTMNSEATNPSGSSNGRIEWVFSRAASVYLAKTETTVAQYLACVEAGACDTKHHMTNSDDSRCGMGEKGDRLPMNCVDWYGASAFCEWVGGRLPTEEEWYAEASAGGTLTYPWGNERVSCGLAVWGDGSKADGCGEGGPKPVCSLTAGNSASGLCDMSGNLWEWTSSWEGYGRVVRGGSWTNDEPEALKASARGWDTIDHWWPFYGFRCARSSPP